MNRGDIEKLEGWLTVPEVAKRIGRKRTRIHQMIDEGKFYSSELRFVSTEKRIYLISEDGVNRHNQVLEDKINKKK
jgi:hypothetical protein